MVHRFNGNCKKTQNYVKNVCLQRQHTPKPAAHVPFAFPPLSLHSDAV